MRVARSIAAGFVLAGWLAGDAAAGVALVRRIEVGAVPGMGSPSGIAFRPEPPAFVLVAPAADGSRSAALWTLDLPAAAAPRVLAVTAIAEVDGAEGFAPSGIGYRSGSGTFFLVDDQSLRLLEVDASGRPLANRDLGELTPGAHDPEGVTFDASGQRLWVSDGRAQQVLELSTVGELRRTLPLDASLFQDAEGITYDAAGDRLFLVSDRGGLLAELSLGGELLGLHSLIDLGAIRPRGITLAPSSGEPGATNLYVADAMHGDGATGRVLEVALVRRPPGSRVLAVQLGDADGFGFRGDEPGFARGDLDRDGLLEPGERLPSRAARDHRDPEDPRSTDATHVVAEGRPLALTFAAPLAGRRPLWARLHLVVADARSLPGRRNLVFADGRLVGELVPSRNGRIQPGAIESIALELAPPCLRNLEDGWLHVELAREPGTGSDDLMLDYARLEVAVAEDGASAATPPPAAPAADAELPDDLEVGAYVEVEVRLDASGNLLADEIDIQPLAEDADRVRGTVDSVLAERGTLVVAGIPLELESGARLRDASGAASSLAALAPGARVDARGRFRGGVLHTRSLLRAPESANGSARLDLAGSVEEVGGVYFGLLGLRVRVTSETWVEVD